VLHGRGGSAPPERSFPIDQLLQSSARWTPESVVMAVAKVLDRDNEPNRGRHESTSITPPRTGCRASPTRGQRVGRLVTVMSVARGGMGANGEFGSGLFRAFRTASRSNIRHDRSVDLGRNVMVRRIEVR
jgi:hypothetical protein